MLPPKKLPPSLEAWNHEHVLPSGSCGGVALAQRLSGGCSEAAGCSLLKAWLTQDPVVSSLMWILMEVAGSSGPLCGGTDHMASAFSPRELPKRTREWVMRLWATLSLINYFQKKCAITPVIAYWIHRLTLVWCGGGNTGYDTRRAITGRCLLQTHLTLSVLH